MGLLQEMNNIFKRNLSITDKPKGDPKDSNRHHNAVKIPHIENPTIEEKVVVNPTPKDMMK